MKTRPRTILILVGIFVVGAATGVMLAWRVLPPWSMRPRTPRPMMSRMIERLDSNLELTKEQRSGIEAILKESFTTLDRMRRESFENGETVIKAMNAKIDALLTPEQRAKFEQLQREQEERLHRQQLNRDPFGGPRGNNGLPPDGGPPGGPMMMPGGLGGPESMEGPGGFPAGQLPPGELPAELPSQQQE